MKLGFTGTQNDISVKQFDAILALLVELRPHAAHHGDCIGADKRFHQICHWLNTENPNYPIDIHIHPPIDDSKRAFCYAGDATIVYEEKEYLVRNHDIVDACDEIIVCPRTSEEELRSGTWATYRYAKKRGKTTHLITP